MSIRVGIPDEGYALVGYKVANIVGLVVGGRLDSKIDGEFEVSKEGTTVGSAEV